MTIKVKRILFYTMPMDDIRTLVNTAGIGKQYTNGSFCPHNMYTILDNIPRPSGTSCAGLNCRDCLGYLPALDEYAYEIILKPHTNLTAIEVAD